MLVPSGIRFARKWVKESIMTMLDRYVWIDLELTGLDITKDRILEIACVITTPELKPFDDGINLVIHQSPEVLNSMNTWCKNQHQKSGLTDSCRNSKILLPEAEAKILSYIQNHIQKDGFNYIAGNSIYMDLMFIKKYMPSVASIFHYRVLDVSALKILCSHWYPEDFKSISKKTNHRALDDIYSSINELKTYKTLFFK